MVIEYNAAALTGLCCLVEPKGTPWQARRTTAFGASQGARSLLPGQRKDYQLVHVDLAGVNLFFVRNEDAEGFAEALPRGMNLELRGRRHADVPMDSFVTV